MIQQSDLKTLAKKYRINEYVVAREYFQVVILKELYAENFSKEVYFKGGTAIRLIYGGKRFSEDLDFTCNNVQDFEHNFPPFLSRLNRNFNIQSKEKETITGRSFLLTGNIEFIKSPIYVRTDFSMRENILEPINQVMTTAYPVIVSDFVRTLSIDELLAEKTRALIKRKKHRDLYDFWILLELDAQFRIELISKKMEYYHEVFDKDVLLHEISLFEKEEFIRDLSPLVGIAEKAKLPKLFDYVKAYIAKALHEISSS